MVFDQSNTAASHAIVIGLQNTKTFAAPQFVNNMQTIQNAMDRGQASAALVIPPDYAEQLQSPIGQPTLLMIINGAENTPAQAVSRAIQGLARDIDGRILVGFAAFAASLVMAFLLGFFMEATLGMIGFWFLEVSSLLFVYMLFNFFFSGHMFPIDMLPGVWGDLVRMIPLQYLAYFPAAVFLGRVTGPALAWGLVVEFAWMVLFMLAARVAFHRGLRRYSGFGG